MMRPPGSGSVAIWMGGIVVALALAVGGVWFAGRAFLAKDATAPAPASQAAATGPDSDHTAFDATAAAAKNAPAPDSSETEPAGPLPRLDEVRHEPDGLVVIAGRVAPFADVILRLDGSEFARAAADGSGAFATVAALAPSDAARILTLTQLDGAGGEIASPDELILAPVRMPDRVDQVAAQANPADAGAEPTVESATMHASEDPSVPVQERDATDATPEGPAETASTIADASGAQAEPDAAGAERQVAALDNSAQEQDRPTVGTDASATTAPETADPTLRAENDTAGTGAVVNPGAAPAATVNQSPRTLASEHHTSDLARDIAATPATAAESLEIAAAPQATSTAPDVLRRAEITDAGSLSQTARASPVLSPNAERARPEAPQPGNGRQIVILRSNEEGVSVVRPASRRPLAMPQVALDSISYSEAGDVELQGRAQEVARQVRVYLDNRPVVSLDVTASGEWRGALPEVDTGVYTLRIDEVDAAGRVTSRVETPFKREAPEVLAAATRNAAAKASAVTVQQGDTLWAISRERYGEGVLYVRVFEANRDSIRDPDLIYPGQIFALPSD